MQDNQVLAVLEEPACEIAMIRDEDGSIVGYTEIWWTDGPSSNDRDETVPAEYARGRIDLEIFRIALSATRESMKH